MQDLINDFKSMMPQQSLAMRWTEIYREWMKILHEYVGKIFTKTLQWVSHELVIQREIAYMSR